MAKEAIGQIICECGHVAEIRRRANGKKLPFKACKHCGVQQGKEALRERWLAGMGQFGTYGEKPDSTPENSNSTNKTGNSDWTPPEELKPEVCEPEENEATPSKSRESSKSDSNYGWGLKAGLVLATIGLAVFGLKIKQNQQG